MCKGYKGGEDWKAKNVGGKQKKVLSCRLFTTMVEHLAPFLTLVLQSTHNSNLLHL